MKKKIILALTACLFAAGSIIHYNLAENTSRLDVSLADISVMAQAAGEAPIGGCAIRCCEGEWLIPPCTYYCDMWCFPTTFCFYTGGSGFYCDWKHYECEDYCTPAECGC